MHNEEEDIDAFLSQMDVSLSQSKTVFDSVLTRQRLSEEQAETRNDATEHANSSRCLGNGDDGTLAVVRLLNPELHRLYMAHNDRNAQEHDVVSNDHTSRVCISDRHIQTESSMDIHHTLLEEERQLLEREQQMNDCIGLQFFPEELEPLVPPTRRRSATTANERLFRLARRKPSLQSVNWDNVISKTLERGADCGECPICIQPLHRLRKGCRSRHNIFDVEKEKTVKSSENSPSTSKSGIFIVC